MLELQAGATKLDLGMRILTSYSKAIKPMSKLSHIKQSDMVAHTIHPSTQEAEAYEFL